MNTKMDTSLVRFVEEAKRYPMLSPEEERQISVAWRDKGDRVALDRLVGSHLRLVVKIARGFAGYGLPIKLAGGWNGVGTCDCGWNGASASSMT